MADDVAPILPPGTMTWQAGLKAESFLETFSKRSRIFHCVISFTHPSLVSVHHHHLSPIAASPMPHPPHHIDPSSSDPHRSVPAPFLTKTYKIVDDPSTDSIISWNEDGTTFVVWRPPEFARDLLPNHFKHNNFSSFVRQLNTYGFRKIVPDRWEFANEFFKKGEKHLLADIHRRKALQPALSTILPSKRSMSPVNSTDEQLLSSNSSPPMSSPTTNGSALSGSADETERLKKENLLLVSELSNLRRLCSALLLFLQKRANVHLQDWGSINSLLHSTEEAAENVAMEDVAGNFGDLLKQLDGIEGTAGGHPVLVCEEVSSQRRHTTETNQVAQMEQSLVNCQMSSSDKNPVQLGRRRNPLIKTEEDGKSPPKLFGVPLQANPCPLSSSNDPQSYCSNVSGGDPPNKLARSSSTTSGWELTLASEHMRLSAAPWVTFIPSPNQRVCN